MEPQASRQHRVPEAAAPAASEPRTRPSAEFSAQLALAENANLRERVARLEASVAHWATDLDGSMAENDRLRREIGGLKAEIKAAETRVITAQDEAAMARADVAERDQRVAALQGELLESDRREIEARRTRTRLHALRRRVRERMQSQAEEIADLREMLSLGLATRRQLETELATLREDAERNERYLDRLEARLAQGGSQGPRSA